MANKYVDLNTGEGFTTGDAGTSGDPFLGCYGMQKALDTVAAGETIFVTGTANLNKLVKLTIGADKTATWVAGDAIRNDTGDGDDWTGVLCEITATVATVELATGDYGTVATADGVENTTRSDTATCSAKSCPGLTIDTTDGTSKAPIIINGCNNSTDWTVGTLAVFDGVNTAHVNTALTITKSRYIYKFLEVKNCGSHGINYTGTSSYDIWYKCSSHNNTGIGFLASNLIAGIFSLCKIYANGNDGIRTGTTTRILFCKIYGNTYTGVQISGSSIIYGSVIYENGRHNIFLESVNGCSIINNVIHGQTSSSYNGIYVTTGTSQFTNLILGNRITGNAGYGIAAYSGATADLAKTFYIDYNYYQSNTTGTVLACEQGANDVNGSDSNYGYTDYANDDYSLTSSASLLGTAIDMDWT